MAKKAEQKTTMSKTEILDKLIQIYIYLILPVSGVAMICGAKISMCCAAILGILASVLSFVKLFIKK